MNKMIEELIKLADILDAGGFYKEAEEIDTLVRRVSTSGEFVQVLKDTFAEAVNNENLPTISDKSLQDIYTVIDAVTNKITFSSPYTERSMDIVQVGEGTQVGEGMLSLMGDIAKFDEQIASATTDDERSTLEYDRNIDIENLEKLQQTAFEWKDGKRADDKQKWEELQQFFKQRGIQSE